MTIPSKMPFAIAVFSTLFLFACDSTPSLSVTPIDNPLGAGAQLPHVSPHPSGAVVSWVDDIPENTDHETTSPKPTHALRYSRLAPSGNWNEVGTIATGSNWFLNWADFPAVSFQPQDSLLAHWLKRSGKSTYAYDVVIAKRAADTQWSPPWTPHRDRTQTEHGFVSHFSIDGKPAIVWLDGRNTASAHQEHDAHGEPGSGAMTLRMRTLDDLNNARDVPQSTLLDDRVCDCCQTAATTTGSGGIVFYRDRSDDEVRDISYVRYSSDSRSWSPPATLHPDNWKIQGCPVNGPQTDAVGEFVAVAWFTASPSPRVMAAVSVDGGASFEPARIVSEDRAQGRVDVVTLDERYFLISWLEQEDGNEGRIEVALFDRSLNELSRTTIARSDASRRGGFARMAALSDDSAVIAWTDWNDAQSRIQTAIIRTR